MKKQILITALLTSISLFSNASVTSKNIIAPSLTPIDQTLTDYSLIVKFKDGSVHDALLSTPETTKIISQQEEMGTYSASSIESFKVRYNVQSDVPESYGSNKIERLSDDVDIDISHSRSLAFKADLIKVSISSSKNINEVMEELLETNDFEFVMIDTPVKSMDFNDPLYGDQKYFEINSPSIKQANGYYASRQNAVNNLGRKLRIAVLDTGYLPHEDLEPYVEGYDFVSINQKDTQFVRDSDPEDFAEYSDGSVCSSQHGLAVTSSMIAKGNNGLGLVGAIDDSQVEHIQARVLSCGIGSTSDILDAASWAGGFSVPGVPDISQKADIINMSLGGHSLIGCSSYEQAVYDQLREAGVMVVVAAGNEGTSANTVVPGGCNNVLTVGATDDITGDIASFSNFGEHVDVMAAGVMILVANNPDFPNQFGEDGDGTTKYIYENGTSFSSPLAASVVGNLKMTHPDLTPDELEALIKYSSKKLDTLKCGTLGCGEGILMGDLASIAITQATTVSSYKKEHRYEGFNTPEEETWLTEMDNFINTCDLVRYSWGYLGFAMDNIDYNIYSSTNGEAMELIDNVEMPQLVYNLADNTEIGVQACKDNVCGSVVEMKGTIVPPNACL